MAYTWEKAKSILVGNLNSGLSYLITTVSGNLIDRGQQGWKREQKL